MATSIRFGPMLATDCPRVWPVSGLSDTISARFLWCVRHHFWKVSRSVIKTVTATIAIIQRLLVGTGFLLGGLHAGDPDPVGHRHGGYLSLTLVHLDEQRSPTLSPAGG